MSNRFLLLATGLLFASFIHNSHAAGPDLSNFEMVFVDEFDTGALDPSIWSTSPLWGPFLRVNQEEQYYLDVNGINSDSAVSPFSFTSDTLIISATEVEPAAPVPLQPAADEDVWKDYPEYVYNDDFDPSSRKYFSGLISTVNSFNATHGYFEIKAKVSDGQGLWPAFWLLTTKYVEDVPEIDIMEYIGQYPDEVNHTYHYFIPEENWRLVSTPTFKTTGDNFSDDFHTYGVLWEPDAITWYVDGDVVKRIGSDEYLISRQSMYLIANLAVGGSWPGAPDETTEFPSTFEIDYIKAYSHRPPETITEETLETDYQLMFADEFSGDSLDTEKWNTNHLWGPYLRINQEEQIYIDQLGTHQNETVKPLIVSNGTLKIIADTIDAADLPSQPDPGSPIDPQYPNYRLNPDYGSSWIPGYSSGIITSYDSFKFVNGYVEIKARVPSGGGLWPAFWLLNGYYVGAQPEIDIIEVNGDHPDVLHHSYHFSNSVGVVESTTTTYDAAGIDYSDDFHRFGVQWHPGEINWYVDGVKTHTLTTPDVSTQVMYIIANLAVGGNFVGPITASFPAQLEIDYIRAYQLKQEPDPDNCAARAGLYLLPDNQWHMLSVPCQAPDEQSTAQALFGDDIDGIYGEDWIIFTYDAAASSYVDRGATGKLNPGEGFWITQITGQTAELDVPTDSVSPTPDSNSLCSTPFSCVSSPLDDSSTANPVWHMVGHPFTSSEPVWFEDLIVQTNTGSCSAGCGVTEAFEHGYTSPGFFHWNGTTYTSLANSGDSMNPWYGHWFATTSEAAGRGPTLLWRSR
jgi:beta-glucanase (GH16 family)